MKELRLEDLTREELIELIRKEYRQPSQRDIAWVIYNRLCNQGHALYGQGIELMDQAKGIKDHNRSQLKHIRGRMIYEKGQKLYERADKIWKQHFGWDAELKTVEEKAA